MQGEIPTRIRPYISSGRSARKRTASANITTGATIQFRPIASPRTFRSRKTVPSSSYRTFASGGYIITIRPIAIGIEVVPTEKPVMIWVTYGTKYPSPIPIAIARKIQSVR